MTHFSEHSPILQEKIDTAERLSLSIKKEERVHDLNLSSLNLAGINLSKLNADRLDFRLADLYGSKICSSRLGKCRFEEAKIEESDWSGCTLRMCIFDGVHGATALFNNARIENSTAKGASLPGVEMKGAKLTETSFERAVLREASLDGAEGDGVEFRGADLHSASLIGVRFNDADFRGADLRGANLSKGCFRNADFRGALLDGTLFKDADLSGAIFDANERPNATSTDKEKSENNDEFADTLVTLLGDNLTKLPGVLNDNKDFIQEITERIQQASDTFKATAKHSPEEWKEWAESFLALAKDKENVDLETIFGALQEGPIKFQDQSLLGAVPKDEMLDRLRALQKLLNSTANEPPDEWKPMLEPLMKMTKAGGGIDFKTVIELLSKK